MRLVHLFQPRLLVAGNRVWLVRIGIVIMLLGLQQLGIITIPRSGRERRMQTRLQSTGSMTSSFLIGATFGAGWSPCAGPILGAILTMAAGQGDPGRSALPWESTPAGLAVPFLLFAALGSRPSIIREAWPPHRHADLHRQWRHHGRGQRDQAWCSVSISNCSFASPLSFPRLPGAHDLTIRQKALNGSGNSRIPRFLALSA
ncbi:MAG: cytochrome c biogenesis CcdA family protein [Thermomicrobiales bacterium]